MNKAPSFKYGTNLPNSLNELKDLPEHLEEFYKAAQPFAININLLDAYWRGSGLGSGGY